MTYKGLRLLQPLSLTSPRTIQPDFTSSFCVMFKKESKILLIGRMSFTTNPVIVIRPESMCSTARALTPLLWWGVSHQIALSDGRGLERLHPAPPSLPRDSGWRNVARLWKKTSRSSPANAFCALALSKSRTANSRHPSRWDADPRTPHTM